MSAKLCGARRTQFDQPAVEVLTGGHSTPSNTAQLLRRDLAFLRAALDKPLRRNDIRWVHRWPVWISSAVGTTMHHSTGLQDSGCQHAWSMDTWRRPWQGSFMIEPSRSSTATPWLHSCPWFRPRIWDNSRPGMRTMSSNLHGLPAPAPAPANADSPHHFEPRPGSSTVPFPTIRRALGETTSAAN